MDVSLESKAITLLEGYEGGNNYIIELKRKSQINKRFYPTRSQAEYIINNHDKQPKVAKKWVILDAYFAQKLADDKLMTCLLYTSPSPRDRQKSRMPSSA